MDDTGKQPVGVDGISQHLSQPSIASICSAVCCYISGRGEQLSQPCVPTLMLSSRKVFLEPADAFPIEAHPCVTLCQQGMEAECGLFCTIETTCARRATLTHALSDEISISFGRTRKKWALHIQWSPAEFRTFTETVLPWRVSGSRPEDREAGAREWLQER